MFIRTIFSLWVLITSLNTLAETVPVGIRPCCALGTALEAEVGVIPVPFFEIDNVVELEELNSHSFNDGSSSILGSIFGAEEEKNGLIFTRDGGFIDTAHVRDTADFTFYLYHRIRNTTDSSQSILLTPEVRNRRIKLNGVEHITGDKRDQTIAYIAGLQAFRLAQWHEIAQWFGLISVGTFNEYASAFSPEDLYSNMVGALLAIELLKADPELTQAQYIKQFPALMVKRLKLLGAQDKQTTINRLKALDGKWWNSSERLPSKWVVSTRDYQFRTTIEPNAIRAGTIVSLDATLKYEKYAQLELLATEDEGELIVLPTTLLNQAIWTHKDFQALADFAKSQDDNQPQSRNELLELTID